MSQVSGKVVSLPNSNNVKGGDDTPRWNLDKYDISKVRREFHRVRDEFRASPSSLADIRARHADLDEALFNAATVANADVEIIERIFSIAERGQAERLVDQEPEALRFGEDMFELFVKDKLPDRR